jgi:hypothetical protein
LSDLAGILSLVSTHFFIDETKAKSYLVAAAVCSDSARAPALRAIRNLILPGQRSIHMKQESSRRRSQIADAVCDLKDTGVELLLLDAGRGPEPEVVRRERALQAVVERAACEPAAKLVLDLDQTLVARDARTLSAAIRETDSRSVTYCHQLLSSQPLLSIPDVVAWCWARGSDWRRRVAPIVTDVIKV